MIASLARQIPLVAVIDALGWTLVHFVWEGAVLGLLVWILLRAARKAAPHVRYLAGCAALVLMCAAAGSTSYWQVSVSLAQSSVAGVSEPAFASDELPDGGLMPPRGTDTTILYDAANSRVIGTKTDITSSNSVVTPTAASFVTSLRLLVAWAAMRIEPWLTLVVALWALGVSLLSLRLLAGWRAVRRMRATDGETADGLLAARFSQLKTRLGISAPVRLVLSTRAAVPMVIGWLKPVVLAPVQLVTGLTAVQLEAVLVHELMHVRRHDYLVNLAQNVVETLFFYHPVVAWVSGRIRIEREHCCDDAAALACGSTLDYARALAALAEFRRSPVFGVAATGGSLVERIRRLTIESHANAQTKAAHAAAPLVSLAFAILLLAAVGGVALAQRSKATATSPNSSAADEIKLLPAKEEHGDVFTVRGRVLKPDGQPAGGARVCVVQLQLSGERERPPLAQTQADAQGEFELSYRKSQLAPWIWRPRPGTETSVLAEATGFGMQWIDWGEIEPAKPLAIQLVPDAPIHGRVVDLQGRPIAGVRVSLQNVEAPKRGSLDAWLDALRQGAEAWGAWQSLGRSPPDARSVAPVITDVDGRFVLTGIGRERVAHLVLRGDTIAWDQFRVATRKMSPVKLGKYDVRTEGGQIFGNDFTFDAYPTQPVVGTVRDVATGQPLAGVEIESWNSAGIPPRLLRTQTDALGRYRLLGMPKGSGNEILAVPNDDQCYFMQRLKVPTKTGTGPTTLDFALHRGLWISGRVTDRVTGKPVSANVHYLPFLTNPYAARVPMFNPNGSCDVEPNRYRTRPDGSYRMPGLPGRAIVVADAILTTYRKGFGAKEIKGMDRYGGFRTHLNPMYADARFDDTLKEIEPAETAQTVTCNLTLDPGESVHMHVVDPNGNPVSGCTVTGWTSWPYDLSAGPAFDVLNLAFGDKRPILILHKQRRLGKFLLLHFDQKTPRTMTVHLEPTAAITGRLLDEQGVGLKGVTLHAATIPGYMGLTPIVCQPDGKFEYRDLPTGCRYELRADVPNIRFPEKVRETAVEAGKTVDLGEVKLSAGRMFPVTAPPSSPQPSFAQMSSTKVGSKEPLAISGKVTNEAGAPISGAHVAAFAARNSPARGDDSALILGETTTGGDGQFRMAVGRTGLSNTRFPMLIARAESHGLEWRIFDVHAPNITAKFTLRKEKVVRGRFVDLQGQPVAGVEAVVRVLLRRSAQLSPSDVVGFPSTQRSPTAWPSTVHSDNAGRFEISGIAATDGLYLEIRGNDRFAPQEVTLNTGFPEERGPRDGTYRPQVVRNLKPGEEPSIPLAPAQIVEGIVRFADTKQPVPHARVMVSASQQRLRSAMGVEGETDAAGRFRINPRRGIQFQVTAYPPDGTPYLVRATDFLEWPAGAPKREVDIDLPRSGLVRGKVVEAGSGQPVENASVQYIPESKTSARSGKGVVTGWQGIVPTDKNGQFAIPVLPGRCWLLVHGPTGDYVLKAIGDRDLSGIGQQGRRFYAHAVQRIDPAPGAAPSEMTIQLKRGVAVAGQLLTPDGRPAPNALVYSRLHISPLVVYWRANAPELAQDGRFVLRGCEPGAEYPVSFLDPDKRLGATVVLSAQDANRPPIVRLVPCGSAKCRFVDAHGAPVADWPINLEMVVTPGKQRFDRSSEHAREFAADSDLIQNFDNQNHPTQQHSDFEGRATFSVLIPGATYRIDGYNNGEWSVAKDFRVESGQTLDLGDITVK